MLPPMFGRMPGAAASAMPIHHDQNWEVTPRGDAEFHVYKGPPISGDFTGTFLNYLKDHDYLNHNWSFYDVQGLMRSPYDLPAIRVQRKSPNTGRPMM